MRLLPDLIADQGRRLRRLLRRFLHLATFPGPAIIAALRPDAGIAASTIGRWPYWPYWLPVLQFLRSHAAVLFELAPRETAEILDTWLRRGAADLPLRREAAEMALAEAERVLRARQADRYALGWDKLDQIIFRAALAAATEEPDRVAAFALAASARRALPKDGPAGDYPLAAPTHRIIETEFGGKREVELAPPRPDGPLDLVDRAFQELCLKGDALLPLMHARPSATREVVLALLIQPPRPKPGQVVSIYSGPPFVDYLGTQPVSWFPPFYTRGPLLLFLAVRPEEGLDTIIRLVNFATDRWVDKWREEGGEPPSVVVSLPDGDRAWLGGSGVYYWYRQDVSIPEPVIVALMALEKWFYDELDTGHPVDSPIRAILERSRSVAFAGLLSAVGRRAPSLLLGTLRPLVAVPEFHLWEHRHVPQPIGDYLFGWMHHDEASREIVRAWHELPHRRRGLDAVALELFLDDPQARPVFEQIRAGWRGRLGGGRDCEVVRRMLEQLVAWYDLDNWMAQPAADGTVQWVFRTSEPPSDGAEVTQEDEQAAQVTGESLSFLTFPLQCRAILASARPLPPDRVEAFWATLQRLAGAAQPAGSDPDTVRAEDAVCGGAAVLLLLHRDWLRHHPERDDWCRSRLLRAIQEPPTETPDDPRSAVEWRWDDFCARALPMLWAEAPGDPALRDAVARLVVRPRYGTVALLFAAAARERGRLGDDFARLQHLLLRWAAARWAGNEPADWQRAQAPAFVEGKLGVGFPAWRELAPRRYDPERWYPGYGGSGHRPRQDPGLDLGLVQAAYAWLPALDAARDETERAAWLTFWREAVDVTIWMLGMANGGEETEHDEEGVEEDEIDGIPYEWDRWVLGGVAVLIPRLRTEDRPGDFWRPIVDLGRPGPYWLEEFLRHWFRYGLDDAGVREPFMREWRAMVAYALKSPTWAVDAVPYPTRTAEPWTQLLGMDPAIATLWGKPQQPAVEALRDLYERWARIYLRWGTCAARFAAFLQLPATQALRLDGVRWLAEGARQRRRDHRWDDTALNDALVGLLDLCWHTQRDALRQPGDRREAFLALLLLLAERQVPAALELQRQMRTAAG